MANNYFSRLFKKIFGRGGEPHPVTEVPFRSFAQRVDEFWKWFGDNSSQLEAFLSENEKNLGFEKAGRLMNEGLDILGEDVYYNIGGHNELTFCVEDRTECYYLYPYLVASMPESLRKTWKVYSCKQPATDINFVFRMYDRQIDIAGIKISIDYSKENNCFNLGYYHPELSHLPESESLKAFYIILELILGEGAVYNYIADVHQADNDEGMFQIGELRAAMKYFVEENGKVYNETPELPIYSYSCTPVEDETRLRHLRNDTLHVTDP